VSALSETAAMRRGLLLYALAAAALAWAAGPAGAQIVVNRSIAGVAPGMTRQAAEAKLGQPKVTWAYDSRGNLVPGVIGGGEPYVTMRYGRGVMPSFAASVVSRGRCPTRPPPPARPGLASRPGCAAPCGLCRPASASSRSTP
jgi:hypothetical protein